MAPASMTPDRVRGWIGEAVPAAVRLVGIREEVLGHFSNEVVRVRLEWSPHDRAAPASLIVKRRLPGREAPAAEAFAKEARILAEIAAPAPVAAPRVHAVSDELLVMSELTVAPFDFVSGATDAHAAAALRALALFHADAARRPLPDWVPSLERARDVRALSDRFDRSLDTHRGALAGLLPGAFMDLAERWRGRLPRIAEALSGTATALHGDAHAENLPMLGDGVAFLDWAAACVGPPAFDVAVFMGMSFPAARRRERERDRVAVHAEAWVAAGREPFVDPWRDYARGLLLRPLQLISQVRDPALLGNPGFVMVLRRCAEAALDHRADAALD